MIHGCESKFDSDWFPLQVKQKQESMNADKEKHGVPGRDKDRIRAAILDESVIVCNSYLVLKAKG